MHIFKISDSHSHCERWGRSLGRYDDGLQKESRHIAPTHKGNEDNLELSASTRGETRRSSVQIRPTPPKAPFAEIAGF